MNETIIKKKQYMGNNTLIEFRIPKETEEIEAWAFAYCKRLKRLYVPQSLRIMGNQILLEADAFENLFVYDFAGKLYEAESRLFALLVRDFNVAVSEGFPLLDTNQFKEQLDLWIKRSLAMEDAEGFLPFLAGGEEDYEAVSDVRERHCFQKRCKKCALILEYLAYKNSISSSIYDYLRNHMIETAEVLAGMEQTVFYLSMLFAYMEQEGRKLSEDMGEEGYAILFQVFQRNRCTEALAFLIQKKDLFSAKADVWSEFGI